MHLATLTALGLPLLPAALAASVSIAGVSHNLGGGKIGVGIGNAANAQGQVQLDTKNDMLYIAQVTIGGNQYPVQLDTGSSDLWVYPPTAVQGASLTGIQVSLKYGIGSADGVVATAPVSFAGFDVPKQAFLNVSAADNPIFSFGAVGILGLGFTSLSQIDHAVNATNEDWGRSLLYNAFVQYPQEPNFIAFLLQRSTDPNIRTEGAFTIGEVEQGYEAVMSTTAISTFPIAQPTRWTVLFEGYSINNGTKKTIKQSAVPDAPQDHGVVLLDSGTSLIYAPEDMVTELYGGITGAQYSASNGLWFVPCDTLINVSFFIGGVEFPIHPLDVVADDGVGDGNCIGTFLPQTLGVGGGEFDILAGDSFLRSVYSVYDFGDFENGSTTMGNPYVKLLSIVPANATAEFKAVRGGSGQPSTGLGSSSTSPSQTSTLTLEDVYKKLQDGIKYAGIALGVLGLGALVLGCLCGAAIMACLNKRKHRREFVPSTGVLPTARAGGNSDSASFLSGTTTRGTYEPVSMYNEEAGKHNYDQPKYNP